MDDSLAILIAAAVQVGIPLLLLLIPLVTGNMIERRHYRSIDRRERLYSGIPTLTGRRCPRDRRVAEARMVTGSVVISYDHFKRFLARLRMVFGGEVKSYVSLVDRGRREAALRLKEQCPDADLILNLRIATSGIYSGKGKQSLGTIEVFAYGTAIRFQPDEARDGIPRLSEPAATPAGP